jgi:DNA-binding transcriptional MocR family regulator
MTAYGELEARDLVRRYVGRGTFVCAADEPTDAPFGWRGRVALGAQRALDPSLRGILSDAGPGTISFGAGTPAPELFPVEMFRRVTDDILRREPATAFGIGPTEGNRPSGRAWPLAGRPPRAGTRRRRRAAGARPDPALPTR